MNWIEIFRTGTHTDSSGHTRDFTKADLDRMATTLAPAVHEPPLVLGHPKDDAPAYGWVKALKREGETLLAAFRDVPEVIGELVAKGRYKKRSISLYPDGRLRHVGLLGAAVPAVQGLKDIAAFAGPAPEGILEFTEFREQSTPTEGSVNPDELKKRVDTLEAENALLKARAEGADGAKIAELEEKIKALAADKEKAEAARQGAEAAFAEAQKKARAVELQTKVDELVAAGKLLPQDKSGVLAFAAALDAGGELEFAEGAGKKPLLTHFFDFLAARPEHGLFYDFTAPAAGRQEATIPYGDIMDKV